jgi:hemerythrin
VTLRWTARFELRIRAMDDQHADLVERIAALEACSCAGGREPTARGFRSLRDAVTAHFADEERYLAAIGYPDLAAHREQHRRMAEALARHLRRFEAGTDPAIDPVVFEFLDGWLHGHLLGSDKRYAAFAALRSPRDPV